MQDGKNLVIAILCVSAFCIKVDANIPLDMAIDAVDDLYEGCTKDALNKFVLSNVFQEELNNSVAFQNAWRQSSTCPKVMSGGLKQHTTALRTIISDESSFRETLNNAVYAYGTNATIYENHFPFKSLHFLLTDSIRLLNPGLTVCTTVYSFSDPTFIAEKGSTVRLGRFWIGFSSLQILKDMRDISDEVILRITTCFYADLGENICNDEPVTLLSPTEEFTVEGVREVEEEESDVTYSMIILKHSQLKSMHNCYLFSRSPGVYFHGLTLGLLIPILFIIIS